MESLAVDAGKSFGLDILPDDLSDRIFSPEMKISIGISSVFLIITIIFLITWLVKKSAGASNAAGYEAGFIIFAIIAGLCWLIVGVEKLATHDNMWMNLVPIP